MQTARVSASFRQGITMEMAREVIGRTKFIRPTGVLGSRRM
jgi:hypothetical protein